MAVPYEHGPQDTDIDGGTIVNSKSEVLSRLDALEAEAKRLREILSEPAVVTYRYDRVYVATRTSKSSGANSYMLLGGDLDNPAFFAFFALDGTQSRWKSPAASPQVAINRIIKDGFQVKEYDSKKAALTAMLEVL